jgi:ceramide glucosyltransferase
LRAEFLGRAAPALFAWFGIAYNLAAIFALLRFRRHGRLPKKGIPLPLADARGSPGSSHPPVSILKPVRGRGPRFYESIVSHAAQRFPQFEILFGVADARDPAVTDIERLRARFPQIPIRIVVTTDAAPNRKVASLEVLAREARHSLLLVTDSDILVEPGYLARVIGLLGDDRIGLVTCLYRGRGSSLAAKAEALGIATEFAPSVLVARLLSAKGFALGSTMAFRRRELDAIGGFEAIREYLADDYQLGVRIAALGKRIAMADTVVETNLGAGSWRDVWKHQVRWSRTIRISRPAGYFGYLATQVTFWSILSGACGYPKPALAGLAIRLTAAAFALSSLGVEGKAQLALVPLRDLLGFAVWCAGLAGKEVEWDGRRFRVRADGRMRTIE